MTSRKTPGGRLNSRGVALVPVAIVLAAILLIWIYREPLLSGIGSHLDNGEVPRKADAIVVLGGGWRGERIVAAEDLKQRGFAPVVVVSGPGLIYGQKECDLAVGMIRTMGRPTDGYLCADSNASSTREEAAAVGQFLRGRGFKSALVVSCDTHMRRASRIWRGVVPDIELAFISAPSPNFDLKRWYATREGLKSVSLEWLKVVTSYFGI